MLHPVIERVGSKTDNPLLSAGRKAGRRGQTVLVGFETYILPILVITTIMKIVVLSPMIRSVSAWSTMSPLYRPPIIQLLSSITGSTTVHSPWQPPRHITPRHSRIYSTSSILHATKDPSTTTNSNNILPNNSSITNATSSNIKATIQQYLPLSKRKRFSVSRKIRQSIGTLFSATGFIASSAWSIVRNPQRFHNQTKQPLLAFYDYLQSSGISNELGSTLQSRSLAMTLTLLRRVHDVVFYNRPVSTASSLSLIEPQLRQDLQRYMRCATAVYGPAMIRAAQVDAGQGSFTDLAGGVGRDVTTMISQHMNLPVEDIIVVQVDDDYSPSNDQDESHSTTQLPKVDSTPHILRHLVAIDHEHQQVMLVLRGTFSIQEIVVDIVSFARQDFCGVGQAHEGMATMAEEVWKAAGTTILDTLQAHPMYELVVIGHSLGAGTACLLTIMLQETPGLLPPGTTLRCIAFASPPVFLSSTSSARTTDPEESPQRDHRAYPIINVIHEHDAVPFLSVYSVRYLLASLETLRSAAAAKEFKWSQKLAIAVGSAPPPQALLDCLPEASAVTPKVGAPKLQVPSEQTLWLRQRDEEDEGAGEDDSDVRYQLYKYPSSDPSLEFEIPWEIHIHPNMLADHLPSRYEYALEHLKPGPESGIPVPTGQAM